MQFLLNDQLVDKALGAQVPALDYLRHQARLKGVKCGCREGDCGACNVLLGGMEGADPVYRSRSSCLLLLGHVQGKHLVTIEGLNQYQLNLVQQTILEENASQCGFCTPGLIICVYDYLCNSKELDPEEGVTAVEGVICRCTGYASIRRAIKKISAHYLSRLDPHEDRIPALVREKALPPYFANAGQKLSNLRNPPIKGDLIVAGATDLLIQRPLEVSRSKLFFLSNLDKIKKEEQRVIIGSGVTAEQLKNAGLIFSKHMDLIGAQTLRNAATVGGNIINASPIGDLCVMLLALNAALALKLDNKLRTLELKDFFLGYKQIDLKPGEILENISYFNTGEDLRFNFEKVSKRQHLDIASVNSGCAIRVKKKKIQWASLSAGGVAPIPLFLEKTSAFLVNKSLDPETVILASRIAASEVSPISDVRGSKTYKSRLLRRLILAHFVTLFDLEIIP